VSKRPFIIGLTGSIGMGKSTTAQMFVDHGLPVWDADAAVARLYAPDGGAAEKLQKVVAGVAVPDGSVNREVLKAWIASDPTALAQIEAIVHPLVARDRESFLNNTDARVVVLDVPLLFETGLSDEVDLTVVVTTSPERQRERVLARPGMTEAQFSHLLEKQMSDSEKRTRADVIVRSDTMELARRDVATLMEQIHA